MDAPIRAPSEAGGGFLERLLDEAERGMIPPPVKEPSAVTDAPAGASAPVGIGASPFMGGGAPGVSPGSVPGASPGTSPGNLLSGLLGNPAMMAALPSLLENLAPLLGGTHLSGGAPTPGRALPTGEAAPGGDIRLGSGAEKGTAPPAGKPPVPKDRHTVLLCAVKPYLSPERQAAADTLLRLCRVWDALAKAGVDLGSLGALFGSPGGLPVGAATDPGRGTEEVT